VGPLEALGEEELLHALSLVQVGLDPEAAAVADQVLGEGEHAVDVELFDLGVVEIELGQRELLLDPGQVLLVGLLVERRVVDVGPDEPLLALP
jgi:hypothetical protein